MEKESNISLGGAFISLALFPQTTFGERKKKHFGSILQPSQSFFDLLTTQTRTIRRGDLRFAKQISPLLNY